MITVEDFKAHFFRDFPYLPEYVEGKAYFKGDIVYQEPNFYQSLIDGNTKPLDDQEAWSFANISADSYLSDRDIEKAIEEAEMSFPVDMFPGDEAKIPSLYLTAFYLVVDIKNSTAGLTSSGYAAFVASKSVGGVSESYAIPAWINNDPMLALYLDNGYGRKYLTFLIPRAKIASVGILAKGGTTVD